MRHSLSVEEIKIRFTVCDAWRVLGYPEPSRWQACLSPWREERKPSFSVFKGGSAFNDFSTDEGGDVIRFWALSRGVNDAEALKEIRNHLGDVSYLPESQLPAVSNDKLKAKKRIVFPSNMRPPRSLEYEAFSRKRRIDPRVIQAISLLDKGDEDAYTRIRYGSHRGQASLVFIEKCGEVINTACRRSDGEPYETNSGEVKELCLARSSRNLPLGNSYLPSTDNTPVMLCEGTPEFLTAWHIILRQKVRGHNLPAVPLGMLGASNSIYSQTLQYLAGRRVRIYPHLDQKGQGEDAMQRWGNELHRLGCKIDIFDFTPYRQENGKQVSDLNDLLFISPEQKRTLTEILPR